MEVHDIDTRHTQNENAVAAHSKQSLMAYRAQQKSLGCHSGHLSFSLAADLSYGRPWCVADFADTCCGVYSL